MNRDAGRGDWLFVTLRLESGEELPFVVDTGSPWTLFDKSFESKLGTRLDAGTVWIFGVEHESVAYAAPRLYLGNTPLMMTGTHVATYDCKQLPSKAGRPIMGILGMNCLGNYCIQLDFAAGKLRFLGGEHSNKKGWGKPFSLTDLGDGCFSVSENLVGVKGSGSLIDTGFNSDGWLTPNSFQQWTNHAKLAVDGEVRSPHVVFGGETYPDIHLGELSHRGFGGIGLSFLSRHLVTLDFPNRTMYLRRTSIGPLVDENMEVAARSAGESAAKFLKSLEKKGQLPGWSKDDELADREVAFHFIYPDSGTFCFVKKNDSSIYRYEFTRAPKGSPWKLQKAWRTDQNDKIVEEYPVP